MIPIALLLGVLSVPSSSNVDYLPSLEFNNPYEIKEDAEDLLLTKINEIRKKNGLNTVTESAVLNKSSQYKSMYISQYQDNLSAAKFVSGPLKDKGRAELYPYVKNEEVIYLNDNGLAQDEILASYFSKTLKNEYKAGRILLNANTKSVGISIVHAGKITICVIHSSDNGNLSGDVNVIPAEIVKADKTAPVVSVSDIYVAKDSSLPKQKVEKAVSYTDNSGEGCNIDYDIKQVNTSATGEYTLNISVTDKAGNKANAVMKVNVVPPVAPVITDDEITLPIVSFDDIYDLSKYINVNDNYGIEYINTEPAFALRGDEGKSVRITVMNKAGLVSEKTVSLSFKEIEHYESPAVKVNSIYPKANEPLTMEMIKSAVMCNEDGAIIDVDADSFSGINREVKGVYYCRVNVKVYRNESYIQTPVAVPVHITNDNITNDNILRTTVPGFELKYAKLSKSGYIEENSHIVLSAEHAAENAVYSFAVRKYGEEAYVINRSSGTLIWYPETEGLYEITVTVKDNANGIIGSSSMNLYVSDMALAEVRNPHFELKPGSEYIMDSEKALISNIVPRLTVNEFLGNFVVNDEGVQGVFIRITNIEGALMTGDNILGTGSTIELCKENTVYEKYEVLLFGDVNGDGAIDISDYAYVRHSILGNVQIDGIRLMAANIAEREQPDINITDYAMLRQHLLGNYEIKQK